MALAEAKSQLSGRAQGYGRSPMAASGRRPAQARPAGFGQPFSKGIFVHADVAGDGDRDARLFWQSGVDPSVVVAEAEPISPTHIDAFDIARFADKADLVMDGHGHEALLLDDGEHQIQLDIRRGTLGKGPVRLRYVVEGNQQVDAKLRTLTRLRAFQRLGRFPKALFPIETGAAKWALALQAFDGAASGASHREIAVALYSERRVAEEWNGASDFLRMRVRRLLTFARRMVDGEYTKLLH